MMPIPNEAPPQTDKACLAERTIESSETMIHMSMIHLMSRRLATQNSKATKGKH